MPTVTRLVTRSPPFLALVPSAYINVRFSLILSAWPPHLNMPPRKVNKRNSTQCKDDLLLNIGSISLAMRPCKNCVSARVICRVGEDSEKWIECVSFDIRCNLAISSDTLKRIHNERKRICEKIREARAKLSRLKRQLKVLKDQKEELISQE